MDFSDIRAYPEKLFKPYWEKITGDPHFTALVEKLGKGQQWIAKKLHHLANWDQFRYAMVHFVDQIVRRTTKGISFSGADELKKHRGAIFMSNHRSTSLDPILFNYMLHSVTGETAFNAVGDNLLNTPWLGHLIRLNRGFIVKRNVEDPDKKIEEAEKLSLYIRHLVKNGQNVWIAQRNGRAKDGNDRTDSAVLTMLKMAHRDKNWAEFSNAIPLIPVSISYEEIPLDTLIAKDSIGMMDTSDESRDGNQMVAEIRQKKRRIHIHVSSNVTGNKRSDIIKELDRRIICGTRIWNSNRYAAGLLQKMQRFGTASFDGVQWLRKKLKGQEAAVRTALVRLYAAPAINRSKLDR